MQSLRLLDFPQCIHTALDKLLEGLTTVQSVPIVGQAEMMDRIIYEIIYGLRVRGPGNYSRRYTAIQELHTTQILLQFFNSGSAKILSVNSTVVKHKLFAAVVSPTIEPRACESLICKLISLAITTGSSQLLDIAAVWMQSQREEGEVGMGLMEKVVERLVSEYCDPSLVDVGKAFQEIPNVSEKFASSFLCIATTVFTLPGLQSEKPELPYEFLRVITHWLTDRPSLCLIGRCPSAADQSVIGEISAVWGDSSGRGDEGQSLTLCRGNSLPGLMSWICCSPFVQSHENLSSLETTSALSRGSVLRLATSNTSPAPDWSTLWPCLQLAVLRGIQAYDVKSSHDNLQPITVSDLSQLIDDLSALSKQKRDMVENEQPLIKATEALLQILSIALSSGAFACSQGDLEQIWQSLPKCRFLDVVAKNSSWLRPAVR